VGIGGAAAVYLIGLRLLRVPELAMLRDAVRRRAVTAPVGVPDAGSADA